ncbi:MAG: glycoside hydrolase family 3 protein [Acidimicrobiia bacterium]
MTAGGIALVAFSGTSVDSQVAEVVSDPRVAGVTLYRSLNIVDATQTRRLTTGLAEAAGRPLLVAVDQEGGQLLGAGPETTPFAGNMALGAVGDPGLASEVAAAIGRELRALGINVDYAPVADVASRPDNPSLGIRSFGEDPESVATLTRAFVTGLQEAGVAATLKHFPGKGEAGVDPHDELPVLDLDLERLDRVELVPFRAGIEAGAKLLMVGHYGLPAITGAGQLPASASRVILEDLIRHRLGFGGLVVTDALDMGGFADMRVEDPLDAGADLLLYGPRQAGILPSSPTRPSSGLEDLVEWVSGFPVPELSVVGSAEHRRLASELAARSVTLVRDEPGLIPVQLGQGDRVLAIMPQPVDLTPADTSSLVEPGLAASIRRHDVTTTELVLKRDLGEQHISEAVELAKGHDLVVVGTVDAGSSQAKLVESVLTTGVPTITVAMRTPYDLARYPTAPVHICTYGILPPTMDALTAALFGARIEGRLPVSIPGLYPIGHGLTREVR